ncbi:MFS transporter [Gemelliphila palaticanis]|uniref:MFS transporter n=1 Tax=Gemelliphila palaticanis TaxID=81950 RepID=A0ABX2T314_9BACL|nr:MFS transporter [Gemella palaticanis]MBF0715934.1 MFS transporter [Gemella palaticanis]NYS47864.1 MFS transporter [Gemella palaticanis]
MNIFLKNKLYRWFLTSSSFGYMGRTLFDIAFIIYATNMTNPELAISIVSVATTLPYIISFILGYYADKTKNKYLVLMKTRFYQFMLFVLFILVNIFGVSWWVFVALVLINVLSDILGGYNGYLSMSINTRLVAKEDLSSAIAFRNSIYNSISLGSKALGVFILGLISYNYSYFGMINAGLFLVAFLILKFKRKNIEEHIGEFQEKDSRKISAKNFLKDTLENLKVLKEIKVIYRFIFLFSGMNFYSSAIYALLLVLLVKNNNLLFGNIAYTITLIEMVEIVCVILAGFYQVGFYKNMTLKNNVIIEILIFILYILNILIFQDKIILLILTAIIGYLSGISNPKLDSLILHSVPEDKQTSIYSIFSTIITLTVPLGTVMILFISNAISIQIALYILLSILILLILYSSNFKE